MTRSTFHVYRLGASQPSEYLCGHRVSSKKAYQITVVHVEPYMAMWNCPALAAIYRKFVEQA